MAGQSVAVLDITELSQQVWLWPAADHAVSTVLKGVAYACIFMVANFGYEQTSNKLHESTTRADNANNFP